MILTQGSGDEIWRRVQSDVIPVWIPASETQFAVRYLLRKDKTQSTAFLVAQMCASARNMPSWLNWCFAMPPVSLEDRIRML
jgi:hypothetical protein